MCRRGSQRSALLKKEREEHVATAERIVAAEDRVQELEAAAGC